jgi:UDPglucose--hexose-1-phosphate uridylyltransferase
VGPRQSARSDTPVYDPNCPFCPGNEAHTPAESCRIPEDSDADWRVRVVGNKYPALVDEVATLPGEGLPLQEAEPAIGKHEVIIEAREHDRVFTGLSDAEVAEVMLAYRCSFSASAADERIKHVVIFRNQGPMANASIEHPHSQLAGLAFVPNVLAVRLERSHIYAAENGRALLTDMVQGELAAESRIIEATERFVTFVPFAPTFDCEIWVAPRGLPPRFDAQDDDTLGELGVALRRAVSAMEQAFNRPDYNCILQTPPLIDGAETALPWYFQIIPRRFLAAGFEMGVGVHILVTTPEEAAQRVREALH